MKVEHRPLGSPDFVGTEEGTARAPASSSSQQEFLAFSHLIPAIDLSVIDFFRRRQSGNYRSYLIETLSLHDVRMKQRREGRVDVGVQCFKRYAVAEIDCLGSDISASSSSLCVRLPGAVMHRGCCHPRLWHVS